MWGPGSSSYKPDIAKNLLSVPTMTKNKAMVMFDNEKCMVSKDNNSFVIGSVCGYGKNLYRVNVDKQLYMDREKLNKNRNEAANFVHECKAPSADVWHRRFGHLNHNYVPNDQEGIMHILIGVL